MARNVFCEITLSSCLVPETSERLGFSKSDILSLVCRLYVNQALVHTPHSNPPHHADTVTES